MTPEILTVRFDGGNALSLSHGSERADPLSVCGDTNNGFVSLFNWNLLGDGEHTAIVYDDGIQFDHATFTVATLGAEFIGDIRDYSGDVLLSSPTVGNLQVRLVWSPAQQSFVVSSYQDADNRTSPDTAILRGAGDHLYDFLDNGDRVFPGPFLAGDTLRVEDTVTRRVYVAFWTGQIWTLGMCDPNDRCVDGVKPRVDEDEWPALSCPEE